MVDLRFDVFSSSTVFICLKVSFSQTVGSHLDLRFRIKPTAFSFSFSFFFFNFLPYLIFFFPLLQNSNANDNHF